MTISIYEFSEPDKEVKKRVLALLKSGKQWGYINEIIT